MDERQQLFEIWAPPTSAFSPWAKPLLFAQMAGRSIPRPTPEPALPEQPWAQALDARTAVILDLPGDASVWQALALARRGYRPVPLYNGSLGPKPVVEVGSIITALQDGAPALAALRIPDDTPPAFMIDSRRFTMRHAPGPGWFDNRWVVFPQDFPSGRLLRSRGIGSALVVREGAPGLGDDLAQVLARWRKDGVTLASVDVGSARPDPLHVTPRWRWRPLAALAMVMLGLRRNSAGGFGSRVPIPPPSGGAGYSGFG